MHGAAVTLANKILANTAQYDLILATDMLDLAVFLSITRHRHAHTPTLLYFHENQLCYPWSPRDRDTKTRSDLHYAFINYTSALAADSVYFNSNYNKHSFLSGLPNFLSRYPDFENKETIKQIEDKSQTLSLGMDLQALDRFRPHKSSSKVRPLLLWNHRWEYDKNPKAFCQMLIELIERGVDFDVALLGERFEEEPPYFAKLRQKLGKRLLAYGRVHSFEAYAKWLWQADILPVTSIQDFFGGSVVEAIYCECHPILPKRLSYPDHFDIKKNASRYFETAEEGRDKLERLITSGDWKSPCALRNNVAGYDWSEQIERYDTVLFDAKENIKPA